jgi:hypothetical protein
VVPVLAADSSASNEDILQTALAPLKLKRRRTEELRQALERATRLKLAMFLDLFSGAGLLANAWQKAGYGSLAIDIRRGAQWDLSINGPWRHLAQWAQDGKIVGFMAGFPCTTFSIARQPPLRSKVEPWGRSHLSDKDVSILEAANSMLRCFLVFLRVCIRLRIPCVIENPATSRLFWIPQLRRLARHPHFRRFKFDQCAFGAPWRKPTILYTWHLTDSPGFHVCCKGTQGGCEFSGTPHSQIGGPAGGGSIAKRSQRYPPKLAATLARQIAASAENLALHRCVKLAV